MSISNLFLRMAGKDPEGKAKGISVTENGELLTNKKFSSVSDTLYPTRRVTAEETAAKVKKVPSTAKGLIFTLDISEVTGTFVDGEGVCIQVNFKDATNSKIIYSISTEVSIYTEPQAIIIYPGASSMDAEVQPRRRMAVSSLPMSGYVEFRRPITGTFSEGEGITATGVVTWLE